MLSHTMLRFPILALAATLTFTACCERPQPEKPKATAATVAPATPPPSAPPAAAVYPATLAEGITFGQPGYPVFLAAVSGMSAHEPWGRWSDGTPVTFQFTQPLPLRFTLILTAHAFGPNIGAPIQVKAGASAQMLTLTAENQTYRLDFTLAAPTDRLEFHIPKPTSPADLKQGDDPRQLGIGFIKLQLATAEASAAPSSPAPAGATYAAGIAASTDRLELKQGDTAALTFTLINHSTLTWRSDPPNPINFSYHLLDRDGKMLKYDNPRTVFPQPIAPGQTATLTLKLGADLFPGPGQYRLDFDLVHEGQTWFAEKGSPTLTIPVTVTARKSGGSR